MKKLINLVRLAAAENNAAPRAKEIEYIYVFTPEAGGQGFSAVCVG